MKCRLVKIMSLLAMMCLLPLNVMAEGITCDIVSDQDVSKGEELHVAIKLNQDGNEQIDVFQGILDFDENIFDGIDEDSFELQNGWADYEYNKETHALLVINKYSSTLNEDIITFNLKLKDNFVPTSTRLELRDAIVANENGDINLENVSNSLEVNLTSNDLSNATKKEAFVSKTLESKPVVIYYTLTLVLLELAILVVIILIYRTASKRITTKFQKRALVSTLILIEIVSVTAFFGAESLKGDLDRDNSISYQDVTTLAKHLVNSSFLSNFKLESADMNGDGRLTPSDLSILLRKTYAKTPYVAKLSEALMESNGYEKSSVVDLHFFADVTNDEEIEFVLIEGQKYKVTRANKKTREYIVKMPLSNVSREYNYNITEVILANGRSAKVDYKTSVTVLKDKPEVYGFATKEDLENKKMRVALSIKDDDLAITNSIYELVNNKGEVVSTGELNIGKNVLEFSLDNAVAYKFRFKINYNRGKNSGEYFGVIEDEYDLKIITDYRLKINNLKLVQNGVSTKYLEKNTATSLTFNSSNVSGYAPKKVNIRGREYTVYSLGGGKYSVNVPNTILNGTPLTISKVILANGKVILTKITADYKILSKEPVVNGVSANEYVGESILNVGLDISDEDNILKSATIKVFDENNSLISSDAINDKNLSVNLPTRDTSKYIIRVYGNYDRIFGSSEYSYQDKLLYETSVDATIKAYVNSNDVSYLYPDKNSVVDLIYNITSNYKESVSKIIINNVIYDALKVGTNKYKIEVNVGSEAGVSEYKAQKVIFTSGREASIKTSNSVDVLKDYPVVDNLEINENVEESKLRIAFDFYDNDGAFTSGKIRLTKKETGEEVASENIIIGKNNMEFTLENAVKYNLDIVADCVLDTQTLNQESPNVILGYNLYSNEYRIINDYKLEVNDIETSKDDKVTDYFEANEGIKVTFNSTNVSEYTPTMVVVDGKQYELVYENGKYTFTIDGFMEAGVKVLKFDTIILSNLTRLDVNCTKKIEILKNVPKVSEEETVMEENDVIVKLNIEDGSGILSNLRAIVTNESGEEIFNDNITNEVRFTRNTGKYTIKVFGDYDLDTNELDEGMNQFTQELLFEKIIEN